MDKRCGVQKRVLRFTDSHLHKLHMASNSKESENGVKGFQMRPQNTRTKWQTCQDAIYNPSTKEFLGRTAKSWGNLY